MTSIVPKGAVVETFDPSPQDVAAVSGADLIVMNGLGLDGWLEPVIDVGLPRTCPSCASAEDLPGVEYVAGEGRRGHEPAPLARRPLRRPLRRAPIARRSPSGRPADTGAQRRSGRAATAYAARLAALDGWVREQVGTIPAEDRKIVSFHEAFPYFAQAYGLEIVGSVVGVPGQDPSAGEVAALVDAIKASGAKAVFTEAQFSPDLVEGDRRRGGRDGRERPLQRLAR